MALTYIPESTTVIHRRKLHLHCTHRRCWVFYLFAQIIHKRCVFFLACLYMMGLINWAGPLLTVLHPLPPLPLGSTYRSQEMFLKLWPEIQGDNASNVELDNIWRYRRKLKERRQCSNSNATAAQRVVTPVLQRYLIVEANGGLNQQRSSICNAVALAALMNATLVIPRFDLHNVWKDPRVVSDSILNLRLRICSDYLLEFADIYDEAHFVSSLKDLVTVVHDLPDELMESYNFSISLIPSFRIQAWASPRYYLDEVYPFFQESRVIRISPFANRLATNLPPHIQHLRCIANYKALRFSSTILDLAKKIFTRMAENSIGTGGKYISVHLRFEKDMVAFSGCSYDGGETEKHEMDAAREKGWGKKFMQKDRICDPGLNRARGKCPMTPVEVGMMLKGMGFSSDTPLYLASGRIYDQERYLEPLRRMFPRLETKESLTKADELAPIQGFSTQLAAVDYMVCLFSEVFVMTQGGNFPHFLMGQRRFLYNGHAKTIMPNKSRLVVLLQNTTMSWDSFKDEMEMMLAESDRKSIMVPRAKKSTRKGSVYLNPLPDCRCLWESYNSNPPSSLFGK